MKKVELTKVHYYESCRRHRNAELRTISQAVFDNEVNREIFIKRNVFGHRWVLKVNEEDGDDVKGKKWTRILAYGIVFSCILIAVACGIYISLTEPYAAEEKVNATKNSTQVPKHPITRIIVHEQVTVEGILKKLRAYENMDLRDDHRDKYVKLKDDDKEEKVKDIKKSSICNCTTEDDVCLKLHDGKPPQCVPAKDTKDPSGCGGLCRVNTQFCRILDKSRSVYECVNNTDILKCPERHFNCGNMCVHESKRCDGFRHCKDNSDETNCECDLKTHFHCGGNTSCLEGSKLCDGKVDCWDKSDEMDCNRWCKLGEVPCLSHGQCIAKSKVCDGIINCIDQSDEPLACRSIIQY